MYNFNNNSNRNIKLHLITTNNIYIYIKLLTFAYYLDFYSNIIYINIYSKIKTMKINIFFKLFV